MEQRRSNVISSFSPSPRAATTLLACWQSPARREACCAVASCGMECMDELSGEAEEEKGERRHTRTYRPQRGAQGHALVPQDEDLLDIRKAQEALERGVHHGRRSWGLGRGDWHCLAGPGGWGGGGGARLTGLDLRTRLSVYEVVRVG